MYSIWRRTIQPSAGTFIEVCVGILFTEAECKVNLMDLYVFKEHVSIILQPISRMSRVFIGQTFPGSEGSVKRKSHSGYKANLLYLYS